MAWRSVFRVGRTASVGSYNAIETNPLSFSPTTTTVKQFEAASVRHFFSIRKLFSNTNTLRASSTHAPPFLHFTTRKMIQLQFMASWVPAFVSAMEAEIAANDNHPPFTTFQFATVTKTGFPHNRTLVSRGFLFDDKSTNVLTFCTDKRAEKYGELLANDRFEAVFYFEKARKQFRLRGRARVIDDTYEPTFDLNTIQPRHVIASNISLQNSSDEESDDEGLSVTVPLAKPAETGDVAPQKVPLRFPIISPKQMAQIHLEGSNMSTSFANLHELALMEFTPPSSEEWRLEITRIWGTLLKGLKLGFRGPLPGTPMDDDKQKLIDKISRGVDGKKEDSGIANFAVVAMFIDHVDLYDSEKQRRYFYDRDDSHHWEEQEVCP